jgi:hypothetical protein
VCTTGTGVFRGKLRITKNLEPAGTQKFSVKGEIDLGPLAPALDPSATGISVTIGGFNSLPLMTISIPDGVAPDKETPGWIVGKNGDKWTYKDRDGILVPGITKAMVQHKPSKGLRYYKFSISGRDGDFQVDPMLVPLMFEIVLDSGNASQCGVIRFNPEAGEKPNCKSRKAGNSIGCG